MQVFKAIKGTNNSTTDKDAYVIPCLVLATTREASERPDGVLL